MVPLTKHAIVSQLTFFLWCVGTFCWKGLVNHQEHLLEGHLIWAAGCFFLSAVVEFWILFCFNPLILKQNSKAENHKKPQQLHFFSLVLLLPPSVSTGLSRAFFTFGLCFLASVSLLAHSDRLPSFLLIGLLCNCSCAFHSAHPLVHFQFSLYFSSFEQPTP